MSHGTLERYLTDLYTDQVKKGDWKQVRLVRKLLNMFTEVKEEGFVDTLIPESVDLILQAAVINGFLGMPKVSRLYKLFLGKPHQVVTEQDIIEYVWEGEVKSSSNLSQTIKRLRRILASNESLPQGEIRVVYGKGYQFIPRL